MSIPMETFSACIRYWFTIIRCVARACCEGGPKTPEKSMWLSLQQYGRGQLHTPARFEQRFLALGSVGHAETVYDKKKEKEHSNLLRMRYSSIEVGNSLVFLVPRARARGSLAKPNELWDRWTAAAVEIYNLADVAT